MSSFLERRFIRYLLVGAVNTSINYGVYAALLYVGFGFRVASLLSLILGVCISFATQGAVVFRNVTMMAFVKFVAAWACLYFLNIGVIALLLRFSMDEYLAGALALLPTVLTSYFVLKHLVFMPGRDSHSDRLSGR